MDREKLLRQIILTCRDFVRDVSYHRAMLPHAKDSRVNFWIYTFNNFMGMAVLNWCHLFGNDNDDLHWKNIIQDKDRFRDGLLQAVGINFEEWIEYRKSITDYRNKDVAHLEVRAITNVPQMDLAIEAARYYYKVALKELKILGDYEILPSDLGRYHAEVSELADRYVNRHIIGLF